MTPTDPTGAHGSLDSHSTGGAGGPSPHDTHTQNGSQKGCGVVGPPTPPDPPKSWSTAIGNSVGREAPTPTDPPPGNTPAMKSSAGPSASTPPAPLISPAGANLSAAALADPFLALAADVLSDLESARIANENRLRQLTRPADQLDEDGAARGFGLDETHPDVARLAALVAGLAASEHQATLNLSRLMRRHPLGPWVARTIGVGEKQAARLLGVIGDPSWNATADRPRTVRELYSYSGYGDAARQVRRRGERNSWSADAKMRTRMIADSCVRQATSPYRPVYDDGRARYADATHDGPCVRCGPSGHPAPAGSPLSLAHQDGRARRLVCKAILRDLWREATTIREASVR